MIEIGGTVGDIEGDLSRSHQGALGRGGFENFLFVRVTYVLPYLRVTSEFKTKPTQQSVQLLRRIGIQPQMIAVRSEEPVERTSLERSPSSAASKGDGLQSADSKNVYDVPRSFTLTAFTER